MAQRKGMMKGKGRGYKNVVGKDPMVHSQSAKGMKQPQKVGSLGRLINPKPRRHWDDLSDEEREYFMLNQNIDNQEEYAMYLKGFGLKVAPKKAKGDIDFFRDKDGKISATRLSPYGKRQLSQLDGAILYFKDGTLYLNGNKLINRETGKVIDTVDNDRFVNKLIFKLI